MTTTPPVAPSGSSDPGPHEGPRVTRDEMRDLGRLRRSAYDRKIAGVAGGLARHLDIDPTILRVSFVVLSFFGGAGLIGYGACWLLVPDERTQDATVRLDERSRTFALWLAGLVAALALVSESFGGWSFPWPLAVLGLVAVAVMAVRGDRPVPPPYAAPPARPGVTPGVMPGDAPGDASGAAPGAAAAAYPPAAYPAYVPAPVPPHPRPPRRRGPLLFWFTLALIALAEGVLGIVDLAGATVSDSSYPALALGITGAMLLLGAFYGRAGGLIAVGLVAALATAAATVFEEVDGGHVRDTPQTAAEVDDRYQVNAGEIVLDLREVEDLDGLDGRTIDLESTFGRIVVLVPDGLDVDADAVIDAGGRTTLFGDEHDGSDSHFHDGGDDVPLLHLDAEVTFGEIVVDTHRSTR
ncbi:PspC domain-containing protein [Nocardioides sp. cx-173]|uniref:PspC domain-containing protein n=1 Tax=Nocardioides sp. cx-173 TaxID=2898796 RepID=UPI001E4CA0F4|nr:PspC domain-containing protein [Nocardioides sp. cx-173]MCD4524604.1 PspC domain-containing protein [Nocardioides sp. cx-173]UGB42914.1 PspC domain-containing protein [Nocardioides sp. cx-173]